MFHRFVFDRRWKIKTIRVVWRLLQHVLFLKYFFAFYEQITHQHIFSHSKSRLKVVVMKFFFFMKVLRSLLTALVNFFPFFRCCPYCVFFPLCSKKMNVLLYDPPPLLSGWGLVNLCVCVCVDIIRAFWWINQNYPVHIWELLGLTFVIPFCFTHTNNW